MNDIIIIFPEPGNQFEVKKITFAQTLTQLKQYTNVGKIEEDSQRSNVNVKPLVMHVILFCHRYAVRVSWNRKGQTFL